MMFFRKGLLHRLLLPVLFSFSLLAAPGGAEAQAQVEVSTAGIIRALKGIGYTEVTSERTLLGRTRIIARGENILREVIYDPHTDDVLRDLALGNVDGAGDVSQLYNWEAVMADTPEEARLLTEKGKGPAVWLHRSRRERAIGDRLIDLPRIGGSEVTQ